MAAEADCTELKWEGKVIAKLHKTTPEQVWLLLEDFCSFNKWLPTIDTCYRVDYGGEDGALVRYCAATILTPSGGGDGEGDGGGVVKWCREKLLDIDPIGKRLIYEVLDNNMGIKSYRSTIQVVAGINGGDDGCQIEWSFLADPIEGLSYDDMVNYLDVSLQGMAQNMEKALIMESFN